jgi:hypothetical protein
MAIPSTMTAEELHMFSLDIIKGLEAHRMHVSSYACDGTETERSVQRLLISKASQKMIRTIPHPVSGCRDIEFTYALYNNMAMVIIQDSKHALKTYRNNNFSGARLLTLGNSVAMYGHVRDLAFAEDGPLFVRDVEKIDRQDDNAAARLFSADVLHYLVKQSPGRIGEIVYLFVMGEVIDAYQNRHILHTLNA